MSMANRYSGKVKASGQHDPQILARARTEVWLRRIENTPSPENAVKAVLEMLRDGREKAE
jgi:hypothetical protein